LLSRQRGAVHKKQMPFWRSPATSRPRCQGRVGFAFTGAKRTPLTEEAGGLGAVFPQKGRQEKGRFHRKLTEWLLVYVTCAGWLRILVRSTSATYTNATKQWEAKAGVLRL